MAETEYTSVTWTTGDTLTEAKLDNMVANDQAETGYPSIECAGGCGQTLQKHDSRGRSRKYRNLHYNKMKGNKHSGQFNKGNIPSNKKNGLTVLSNGYVRHNKTRKYLHRLLMERWLGRELKTEEHIHHVDGDKQNNSLRNLILIQRSDHVAMHNRRLYG